jgi:ABC-2 type transport system ATP-binding protein
MTQIAIRAEHLTRVFRDLRALCHRPALVFLDEPTAGLDPVASAALRDELAALAAREGVTVFLTTHNLAEAEKPGQPFGAHEPVPE